MAIVIPIGEPVNEAERRTIRHLRDHLPGGYLLVHNFEIARGGEVFEIDLAVLAPHAVYLCDVKGTRGLIDVYGPKWYPDGRQPYTSPLIKLRAHARSVKGVITDSLPGGATSRGSSSTRPSSSPRPGPCSRTRPAETGRASPRSTRRSRSSRTRAGSAGASPGTSGLFTTWC